MTLALSDTLWSGLETPGMLDAKCSLLLQEESSHDVKIKTLTKQRVLVYQDKGFNPATSSSPPTSEDNFYVDFPGATILQLEPTIGTGPQTTMPITLTVGGRCVFTPENYQDFRVMMRTKEQSQEMSIAPNGNFDWPDVQSLLLCPCCGKSGAVPRPGDKKEHEYWMVFYPLLQITVLKGSQLTLGTRTVCRLVCLDCMEDLLEGLSLKVLPGGSNRFSTNSTESQSNDEQSRKTKLAFTLPASDVLAEAGSASFLEDGPPRPETHPHVDDILDAWTLYNLWEHSGAWEALQNDYRTVLARSMHAEPTDLKSNSAHDNGVMEARLKDRLGRPCGNPSCLKVHGKLDLETGEVIRLCIKCRECHSEFYCSKECREAAKDEHQSDCLLKRQEREERREKKAKKVECDTCQRKFPYTKMKKCSSCRIATYCSVDCQRVDWQQRHKFQCKRCDV
jgi:MYND finger